MPEMTQGGGLVEGRWSTGSRRRGIAAGDRGFLMRVGQVPDRGVIASCHFTTEVYEDEGWQEQDDAAFYADVVWDLWLDPSDAVPVALLESRIPEVTWSGGLRGSGVQVPVGAAPRLEQLWSRHLGGLRLSPSTPAYDLPASYAEGASTTVRVNRYERDARARAACIAKHGTACAVCGFDFEQVFGRLGKGYVEVHHIEDIALGEREVDPERDLIPLCPNCHAMAHRGARPARSIEHLRTVLARRRGRGMS